MIEVLSHQELIDRNVMIPKEIKYLLPLHFLVQKQASNCMVFLLIQSGLMSLVDTSPVYIFQI